MTLHWIAGLAFLALAEPAAAQAPATPAALSVPDIAYRERVLPNGLRVFTMRDASTPNVAVQVFYGVGAKNDPEGRSGFAHLFEHLMFKRTRNMPDEMMDRLTEDVGGTNNASTGDDFTNYYEVVPANHLQRILWAEAERLGSLVVDEKNFASERDVVKEELRQRVLADPYGRFFRYLIPQSSFSVHPYGRSAIGSIEDLDAATLEDVRSFHRTYYRPDNAALIVAGNFDPVQLDRWIDRYFGPIARPAAALPVVTVVEPERTGPRTVTGYGPNVPLPALAITWPAPPADHPDVPALSVLNAVLSSGESSRMYRSLIYDQKLAQAAFASAEIRQQPSIFSTTMIMASGKTLDQGEAALMAEVARVRDAPVTAAELTEAKTEFLAGAIRVREVNERKAFVLGVAVIVGGDASQVNTNLDKAMAVTAADVQRVARRYLDPEKRVVVRYLPESARPPGETSAAASPAQPSPPVAARPPMAAASATEPVPESQRVQPPPVGPAVRVSIPTPAERVLANGLRVIVASERDTPLVTAQMLVRSGAEVDPDDRAGLAALTAGLLTQGAGSRSASEIAAEIERLGGSLSSSAGWDASRATLNVVSPNLAPALGILADVVRRPTFAGEELERLRTQSLDGLRVALREPGSIAGMVIEPAVFGALYDHPEDGTPASLPRITRADVATLHRTHYRPDNAVLVLTGDLAAEQGFALAERLFGGWARPATALPARPASAPRAVPANGSRVVVVDLPDSGQAAVWVARPGIRRDDPQYYTALVANSLLGGGYSARLNQEIRIKRGLSYGARSALEPRRGGGLAYAAVQTKPESADEVVEVLLAELDRLGDTAAADAELGPRKAVLVGGFGRSVETTGGLAGLLSGLALHGLPLSEINSYLPNVEGVNAGQVQAYADQGLSPGGSTIVVAGDAKAFLPTLRRRFPNLEVIPVDELDFESPTLR